MSLLLSVNLLAGAANVVAAAAEAVSVEVKGLFSGSALLVIDGQQKLLKVGKGYRGVTLVSASSKGAVIDIEGKQHTLGLSRRIASSFQSADIHEVRLQPGRGGHYVTPARINNRPVSVMVDTGATAVAMSLPQARALGIDYRNGELVPVSTANGIVNGYRVTLSSVTVGTVKVNNVAALVSMSDFPGEILLGNSYLSRVKMFKENGVLVFQN
ncbi:TIGR02281 family clan AA aspartic protease [Aestuariicella hydrocarbonica]|uniref:TIGR02281 family clan AA aspartic protease n=1 Tax=Pseudomaricurvus hydrocarbonicus TaxID=1470433 RepID=A0A9E5MPU9_9GAMM|nr:TIGR02281 family clan AA aspartic protease [Aestuariicella hydrocarbonica]NHO68170.1 TIGR02281 family clan AA aspartic protease [Aestuariicella hydrocarbonica]